MNSSRLLNSLFTIEELNTTSETDVALISLNRESEIYKAHFPNDPITPGVGQLTMIKDVLSILYPELDFHLDSAKQIKFVDVIRPTEIEKIRIELNHHIQENKIYVDARIFGNEKDYLKAKMIYLVRA